MSSPWRRRLIIVLVLGLAFFIGSTAQQSLGISFSIEGLEAFREWVAGLGFWGPIVFILLVICRLFIGLSSHLILIIGGLVFGAAGGVLWGSIGLWLSSLVLFLLAQQLGADWVQRRFGDQYAAMVERIQRVGAGAIFAITAHPVGLLTPAHLAAGLVNIKPSHFASAVAIAAPVRALPYAVLGTAVLDLSTGQLLLAGGALLIVFVLPLLHPTVREWVWGVSSKISKDHQG